MNHVKILSASKVCRTTRRIISQSVHPSITGRSPSPEKPHRMLEKAKAGETRAKEAKCSRYKGSERPQETRSPTLSEVFIIICVQTQSKPE